MKDSGTCAKCACTTVYVIANASASALRLVAYDAFEMVPGQYDAKVVRKQAGAVEAWICSRCGFTELFATDLPLLGKLAAEGKLVRAQSREGDGPYR